MYKSNAILWFTVVIYINLDKKTNGTDNRTYGTQSPGKQLTAGHTRNNCRKS